MHAGYAVHQIFLLLDLPLCSAVFMCKHVLYVSSIDLSFNARCGYSTTCMHVYMYVYVLPSVYIGWIRTCVHI